MNTEEKDVRGIRMRWEEEGEGFPVVFLHGIPTSPKLWRHVVPLVEGARCLAWEMVGYGRSMVEGAGRDISVRHQADYLLSWMGAVGVDRAVLVGHDLGGGVAQIVAAHRPERCAGLVLTNSICYDSWPIPSFRAMRAVGPLMERLPERVNQAVFAVMLARGHDDVKRGAESLIEHWRNYAERDAGRELLRQVDALHTRDTLEIAPRLPRLGIPARVVWGTADPFIPVAYGERLAGDLGTVLQRIEGGKHFTPEDHAEAVAGAVNDLLREVAGVQAA
jgi:pimeloyl-ACP methyl ester carboxylesterase